MTTRTRSAVTCDGRDPVCAVLREYYPALHRAIHGSAKARWRRLSLVGGPGMPKLLDALRVELAQGIVEAGEAGEGERLHEAIALALAQALLFGAHLGAEGPR